MLGGMIAALSVILACIACTALSWRQRLARGRMRAGLDRAEAARDVAQRAARLASLELREAALRLHGQAGAPLSAGALAALAQRFRTLADDLGVAGRSADPPTLEEEPIDLLECAHEAADGIAAAIAPGRREFRIEPGAARLWADRRAVRQILTRVLTEAVLSSREGDWVVVSVADAAGLLRLDVADEGRGLASGSGSGVAVRRDSRGVGVGLALARSLMEAHGGRLEIVAAPGAGTRFSLCFPAQRRRGGGARTGGPAIRAIQPS